MPWLPGEKGSDFDPRAEPEDPDNPDYEALWERFYSAYFMSKAMQASYLGDSAEDIQSELSVIILPKIQRNWPIIVQRAREQGKRISFKAQINWYLGKAMADIARKTKTEFGKAYEFEREKVGEDGQPSTPAQQVSFKSIDAPISFDDEGVPRTLKDTLKAPGTGDFVDKMEQDEEKALFLKKFNEALSSETEFTKSILLQTLEIIQEGPSSPEEISKMDALDAEEYLKYEESVERASEEEALGNPIPPIYKVKLQKRPTWNSTNIWGRVGRETGQNMNTIKRLLATNPKIQDLLGRPGGVPRENKRKPTFEFDPETSVMVQPTMVLPPLEDYDPEDEDPDGTPPSGVPV